MPVIQADTACRRNLFNATCKKTMTRVVSICCISKAYMLPLHAVGVTVLCCRLLTLLHAVHFVPENS